MSDIARCNLRILTHPRNSPSSSLSLSSFEVHKTVHMGTMLGFNLQGKENDVASLLNNGDCKVHPGMWFLLTLEGWEKTIKEAGQRCFALIIKLSSWGSKKPRQGDGFISILGKWIYIESPCLMIMVYAPQDQRRKDKLWYDLTTIISDHNSLSIVLGGKHFTRMNRSGSKLSKIDRILVSKHIVNLWPNSHIMALPREFSDHSPLLLTNSCVDFGPSPFKFYNSWLLYNDFPSIFLSSWLNSVGHAHLHPVVNFKLKLQALKSTIKNWRSHVKLKESAPTVSLRDMIDAIDTKAEISPLTTQDIKNGTLMVNDLMALEHRNLKELGQKAKVRWALEGDENTRFFHGIINNNRNRSIINGLNILGAWVTDPV
ncbi:cytochrome P450 [Tanacetum coccineum]